MGFPHFAHRRGIGLVERLAVLGRHEGVALRQGLDQGPLDVGSILGGRASAAERLPGLRGPVGRHNRVIDVRPAGHRNAPPAKRTIGIQFGHSPERADRLVVIEGVEEAQALVEVPLGLGLFGRHLAAKIAQSFKQRHRRLRFLLGQCGGRERQNGNETKTENRSRGGHHSSSSWWRPAAWAEAS
jgi:hypothetical protein